MGIIKQNISSGELNVGDLLPSEAELCRTMGISRNTVRQAIGELEEEGLVVRKRGKEPLWPIPMPGASACATPSLRRSPPWAGALIHHGGFRHHCAAPGDQPQNAAPGGRHGVLLHPCVRNVDGEPLILETSYYPQYLYPNLTRELVQTHSIYSLLYHVGIAPAAAEDTYEAVVLDEVQANLLHVPQGSCAFYHQRRTRTEDGRIYEYTCSYIRADRVTLDVHMQKNSMSFNRTVR